MNYDDEVERSRARRSRAKASRKRPSGGYGSAEENRFSSLAEPGSRADKNRTAAGGHRGRRRKSGGGKKKIALCIALGLLAVIAVALIGGYLYLNGLFKSADKNEFDLEDVQNPNITLDQISKMEKGYWTVAIFGVDSRDGSTGKGCLSDVIMIANLNRETGEIKLVSVYRDTYLNINDKNTYNKINEAYAQGGPEQAVKALNKNLDLNITNYATFNWKAVATAINVLGGVDIEISKSEFYYINAFITETVKGTGIGSVQLKSAGMQHLDGVQAVAYGRLRLMDTDYARTERQRIVIQKAFEKAKESSLDTLYQVLGNVFDMCATNVEMVDVAAMIPNAAKYYLGETIGFPMARGEQTINGGAMVIPQTLVSNVTSLHKFLYDEDEYTPSSAVQTISNKIAEVSGLTKAGKEVGHVTTDQGYIPKTTAAAVTTTKADKEEKDEDEAESESESTAEPMTDEDGNPIETAESGESDGESSESREGAAAESSAEESGAAESSPAGPNGPAASGPAAESTSPYRETNEEGGPKSPADVIHETNENYGPGHESTDTPEATMAPTAPTSAETPTTAASSIIVVSPTTAAAETAETVSNGPAAETTAEN